MAEWTLSTVIDLLGSGGSITITVRGAKIELCLSERSDKYEGNAEVTLTPEQVDEVVQRLAAAARKAREVKPCPRSRKTRSSGK